MAYFCKRDSIEFYDLDDLCGLCSEGEAKEVTDSKGNVRVEIVCISEYREVVR